ncbi:MAG: hypothetical protein L6V93_01200 [Clostridiales bacterium]|nr:MAG: hypothetical protein L6V93_01200 [Clostridiales bacterium]
MRLREYWLKQTLHTAKYMSTICASGKRIPRTLKRHSKKKILARKHECDFFTYKKTPILRLTVQIFDLKYDLDKTSENAYQAGKGKNFISRGFNAVKYSLFQKGNSCGNHL